MSYITIMALLIYLPFEPIYMIKAVSIIFDFLLCGAVLLLVRDSGAKEKTLVFTALMLSPVIILNSSCWGQCDSIYVTFLILTLVLIRKEKWFWAFVVYGISFSFKLQAIFMLPFLIVLYLPRKKFSFLIFLIIPVVNVIMCLPAILMGRPISDAFTTYISQTTAYRLMSANCPNLYCICPLPFEFFRTFAVIAAMSILGMGALWSIKEKVNFDLCHMVQFLIWCIWTCCMFLPAMHERYGYCMELLLIVYAIIWKKKIFTAIMSNLITLCAYGSFLFKILSYEMNFLAIANMVLYLMFTIDGVSECNKTMNENEHMV